MSSILSTFRRVSADPYLLGASAVLFALCIYKGSEKLKQILPSTIDYNCRTPYGRAHVHREPGKSMELIVYSTTSEVLFTQYNDFIPHNITVKLTQQFCAQFQTPPQIASEELRRINTGDIFYKCKGLKGQIASVYQNPADLFTYVTINGVERKERRRRSYNPFGFAHAYCLGSANNKFT